MKKDHIKTAISVVIPYPSKGKEGFVYVKTSKDRKWGLPAGKVDLFEEFNHAVAREVKEEIGCEIILENFLGVWDFKSEKGSSISNRVFSGKIVEGELGINRVKEILGLRVFSLGELREMHRRGLLRAGRANLEPVEEYVRGKKFSLSMIHTLF